MGWLGKVFSVLWCGWVELANSFSKFCADGQFNHIWIADCEFWCRLFSVLCVKATPHTPETSRIEQTNCHSNALQFVHSVRDECQFVSFVDTPLPVGWFVLSKLNICSAGSAVGTTTVTSAPTAPQPAGVPALLQVPSAQVGTRFTLPRCIHVKPHCCCCC